jgi:hypothetical protein
MSLMRTNVEPQAAVTPTSAAAALVPAT